MVVHFIIGPIYTLYSLQTGRNRGQQSRRGQQSQKKTWNGKPLVSASWKFFICDLCHPELSFLSWFLLGTTLNLVGKVTKGVWKGFTNPSLWEKALDFSRKKKIQYETYYHPLALLCFATKMKEIYLRTKIGTNLACSSSDHIFTLNFSWYSLNTLMELLHNTLYRLQLVMLSERSQRFWRLGPIFSDIWWRTLSFTSLSWTPPTIEITTY